MSGHVTSGRSKKWHHHFTIDLFASVLSNSIFHPFVAWLVPLCLRAVQAPYDSTEYIASCIYAAAVTAFWMFRIIDQRVAYGLPRQVQWDEEVIVITGGSGGLGRIIAEMFGMRGANVAILDVAKPRQESEGLAGVQFYQCDVGSASAVEKAKELIEKDFGPVSILINNAGIVNGKPIWDLSAQDLKRNFDVNLVSHFNTIRTFLPGMLASDVGGTIVTVASVLGKTGASYLSDYTAAKAGLISMHRSISAELSSRTAPEGAENIRMVLVTPGQLATTLFANLETPSNFFGPVVEPVELAREIVSIIDKGASGEISMPLYARGIEWLNVIPAGLNRILRGLSGIDMAMEKVRAKRITKRED